jgi:hypothetical protein
MKLDEAIKRIKKPGDERAVHDELNALIRQCSMALRCHNDPDSWEFRVLNDRVRRLEQVQDNLYS